MLLKARRVSLGTYSHSECRSDKARILDARKTLPQEIYSMPLLCSDCKGRFSVPIDLTVTEVWMFLEAPKGSAFRVPTPFEGFNCTAPLFVGNQQATYKPETFAAAFDFEPIPLGGRPFRSVLEALSCACEL